MFSSSTASCTRRVLTARAFTQAHSRAPALAAARASARVPAFAPRLGAVAHGGVRRGVQFRRVATAATAKKVNPISAWGKRHPFWFQMIFCTAQAGASDFLIQKYVEKRKNIDLERNAVFIAFGAVYLGGFQYLLYSIWMPRWFPHAKVWADMAIRKKWKDWKGLKVLGAQIALDNFVHNPFIYFPVFYCFKALLEKTEHPKEAADAIARSLEAEKTIIVSNLDTPVSSESPQKRSAWDIAMRALNTYRKNFVVDNISMCALVIPGDILTFGAPMWLRLPANHLISFFWVCYLSFLRGGSDK